MTQSESPSRAFGGHTSHRRRRRRRRRTHAILFSFRTYQQRAQFSTTLRVILRKALCGAREHEHMCAAYKIRVRAPVLLTLLYIRAVFMYYSIHIRFVKTESCDCGGGVVVVVVVFAGLALAADLMGSYRFCTPSLWPYGPHTHTHTPFISSYRATHSTYIVHSPHSIRVCVGGVCYTRHVPHHKCSRSR